MTPGDKVIAKARTYLGVRERPAGSNDDMGGPITRWNAAWGMRRVPWCGTSSDQWSEEAGIPETLGSPSTFQIVANARAAGRLREEPVTGCYVIWNPGATGHVERFIRWVDRTRGQALTIGGNTGDAVREHIRDVRGAYFAVDESLDAPPEPVYRTVYWWEDPRAQPVRHGLYAKEASREKAVAAWVKANGNPGHVRRGKLSVLVNGRLQPRWTFWTGQRKRSPDFTSKARRDADLRKTEGQRPGHKLRPRSKRERLS